MRMTAGFRIWVAGVLMAFVAVFVQAQEPVSGRYVRVEIPKEKATLALAEVQVFSKGENVALKGTATQIGTAYGGGAERANDGNTDTQWGSNSISHTPRDVSNPWWEVDLNEEKPIEKIAVWNRTDAVTQRRNLDGCRLVILDAERKEVWQQTLPEPGKVTEIEVKAPPPVAGAAVPAVTGAAVSATVPELKKYQEIFGETLARLVTEQKTQSRALADKYLATLKLLQERAKKAGNLDYLLVLTEEMGRVTQVKPIAAIEEQDVKFTELKGVRDAYLGALRSDDSKAASKIIGLTQQYERTLTTLQADLTRKDRIDDAMAVKTVREGLEVRPEVAWAKAVMANATTVVPLVLAPAATGMSVGKKDLYMVVDLSGGKDAEKYLVTYLSDVPKDGWADEYKTDKLVLRKILAGTFEMGSPKNETGRPYFDANSGLAETQHSVTLTHDFYIGVFEVTQRQWELVMGDRPSKFANEACYATRPVEKGANYQTIRQDGIDLEKPWPESHSVPASTFLGRLRAKTGLSNFDLPTEAQWEYACRAGSSKALNNNRDLKENKESDKELGKLGRYKINSGAVGNKYSPDSDATKGTAKVGSYLPNAWGLYDMHGNVWEWCLDRTKRYEGGECTDPQGGAVKPLPDGGNFIRRGGGYSSPAVECRAATRNYNYFQNAYGAVGFRLAMTLR